MFVLAERRVRCADVLVVCDYIGPHLAGEGGEWHDMVGAFSYGW